MFKRLAVLLFCLCLAPIYSIDPSLPLVIQFNPVNIPAGNHPIASGLAAFNRSPEIGSFFEMLKKEYKITTVIETGTFQGNTTAFFAKTFEEVHTIDVSPTYQNQAKNNLSPFTNIRFHLGSSEKVLAQILPGMKDRFILFYLDAHWEKYWPLLDELEVINKTHHQRCIVVIDDIKVPGRSDVPYDAYEKNECSYEYVQKKVEKLFDKCKMHYLVPANPSMRAKLVIIPE